MKAFRSRIVSGLSVLALWTTAALGQGSVGNGTFQNLDFEETDTSLGQGRYPFPTLFPGWTGSIAGVSQSTANYENLALDEAQIALLGLPNKPLNFPTPPILDGNYSALLGGGQNPYGSGNVPNPMASASISQTGVLPAGAESIQMKVGEAGNITVALGGVNIPMIPLFPGSSYTLFGGNVGAFAGTSQELTITATAPPASSAIPNWAEIDDIIFSGQSVPEPTTFVLGCTGSSLFLLRRNRKVFVA